VKDRDAVTQLAVQHVLMTLRLDSAVTSRVLSAMTPREFDEMLASVAALQQRVQEHAAERARRAGQTWSCVWGCSFTGDPEEHHRHMHGPLADQQRRPAAHRYDPRLRAVFPTTGVPETSGG
jgi:hypothetical protein